ncbi:MAG: hypothetical protein ACYS3N_20580 [Planctomycetota bacterium]|jgi:hypothetical protein
MKAKKNLIVTIVLLVIILAFVQVTQVAGKAKKQTESTPLPKFIFKQADVLKGLQGVGVVVEGFGIEGEKYGLNNEGFKTDVELQLRQYGVKVLSDEERLRIVGAPALCIDVIFQIHKRIPYAVVNISVELKENVLLERNPAIMTFAATWYAKGLATVALDNISEAREAVKVIVDEFIIDYRAANSKVQPQQQKN